MSRLILNFKHNRIAKIISLGLVAALTITLIAVTQADNAAGSTPTCGGVLPANFTTTANSGTVEVVAFGVDKATSLVFPAWSEVDGQGDIVWYPGIHVAGGDWKVNVDLASHPGLGKIFVDVYMNNASNTNVFCGGIALTRTSGGTTPPPPPPPGPNSAPIGFFDAADCLVIGGWVYDPDEPAKAIVVEIFANGDQNQGTKIFSGLTTGDRSADTGVAGLHGFTIGTPGNLKDGRDHDIWVYAQDSTTNQNTSFANRRVFNSNSTARGCSVTAGPPVVDFVLREKEGRLMSCYNMPISGSPVLEFIADITNRGPGHVRVVKYAAHDNIAGCAPTTDNSNLDDNLVSMSGRTDYPEGASGTAVFAYNTALKNCGRVQVDATYQTDAGVDKVPNPLGVVINYGVNCGAPTTSNNAVCVSIQAPTTVQTGQNFSASVTMRNNGTTTWTAAALYKLGSQNPQDNRNWRDPRVELSNPVAPGSTAVFSFTNIAPASAGTYPFSWKMVQEGKEWFGETCSVSIIVTSAPTPDPTCVGVIPENFTTTATTGTKEVVAFGIANATSVVFPTWSEVNGQDDIVWYPGVHAGGGDWKATIDLSRHPGLGKIFVDVYMSNATKTNVFCKGIAFVRTAPTVGVPQLSAQSGTVAQPCVGSPVITPIKLTFTSVAGATSYKIKRSATSGGPYTALTTLAGNQTTFEDSPAQTNTTFFYVVSAVKDGTESANSNEASARMNLIVGDCPPLLVNNATCPITIQVVQEVQRGQTFSASITMTNTGTKPWTSTDSTPHKLGSQSPQDNMRWGLNRVNLPVSTVSPGQSATFVFTATAPNQVGLFSFNWQMVEEGVEWFGQICGRSINVNDVPPGGAVTMNKLVRNISDNQTTFGATTTADPGEQVEFQIRVEVSNGTVNNIVVADTLPSKLAYVTDSLKIDNVPAGNNPSVINVGSMTNQTKLVTLRANVASVSQFAVGSTNLVNIADLVSSAGNKSGSATVIVVVNGPGTVTCSPNSQTASIDQFVNLTASGGYTSGLYTWTATGGNPSVTNGTSMSTRYSTSGTKTINLESMLSGSPTLSTSCTVIVSSVQTSASLSVDKQVRNITTGSGLSDSVSARPGEQLEYRVVVNSTGSGTANNAVLTDILPNNFTLNFVTMDSGVSQTSSSSLVFNLGSMAPGSSKVIRITVTAGPESNFPIGSSSWVNVASATSPGVSTSTDNAVVIVNRTGVVGNQAALTVNKDVRNLTTGSSFADTTTARTNDRVEFRITVNNNSSATANNVRLIDSLPSSLNLVSGTVRVDGSTSFSGDLFQNNLTLGDLNIGNSRTITFEATVNSNSSNTSAINSVTTFANNVSSISDTATVFISQVLGTNVDLVLSKKAFNQTRGQNATSVTAAVGDVIVYTLTVDNRGNAQSNNFVFEDDVKDVVELGELLDFGGATFNLGAYRLTWPAINIPAGGRVEKTFSVRIRSTFPSGTDYVMTNIYGNRVDVSVVKPAVAGVFVAPKTGSAATISFVLSSLTVAGYFVARKRRMKSIA